MPNEEQRNLDKEWADDVLEKNRLEYVREFLSGNPSPAFGLAANCSERNVEKVLHVLVAVARSEPEEYADEIVSAIMNGLIARYWEHGVSLEFGLSLTKAIKHSGE